MRVLLLPSRSTKPPLERGPSMITRPIDPSTGMKRVASTLEGELEISDVPIRHILKIFLQD